MNEPTVGAWIQSYCTSCRTMREHVIVAMVGKDPVKVECTSCDGQHRYRAAPPGTKKEAEPRAPRTSGRSSAAARRRESSAAAAAAAEAAVDFAAKVNARPAQAYHPQQSYALDDVIDHVSFGRGVVVALPGPQKIEVQFANDRKLLLHDKAATKESTLKPPPRRRDEGGDTAAAATDAPPPVRRL